MTFTQNNTEVAQNIFDSNSTNGLYLGYVKAKNEYHINTKQDDSWIGEQKLVTNTDLGKAKFAEFRDSSFFNDPLSLLKNMWEKLDTDSMYLVRLVCGNSYLAFVLKYVDHTYGSIFIIGYGTGVTPIYSMLNNGVWTDTTVVTNKIII